LPDSRAFGLNQEIGDNSNSEAKVLSADENEIILAQEQDVQVKDNVPGKLKDIVGTLVLTDKRLLFVEANREDEIDIPVGRIKKRSTTVRYAEVDDLGEIASNPNNMSIPLNSIANVSGTEGIIHPPELKITWKSDGNQDRATFTEELIGGRKKDLKDWAKVIADLKAGKISIQRPTGQIPSIDTLEGKILHVLGDMQEKGLFGIEEETETEFKIDLDPDQVEAACEKLTASGFLDKTPDNSGEAFYRKRSPLGEDDLSS
jgi:hypothetical protein